MNRIKSTAIGILRLNGVNLKTLPFLLALSIALVMGYISTVDTTMTNFYERAIGHASIRGADASIRVSAFWTCISIFLFSFFSGSLIIDKGKHYLISRFPKRSFELEKTLFFEFGILVFINEIIFIYHLFELREIPSLKMPAILATVCAIVFLHALISVFRAHKKLPVETPLQSAVAFILPLPLTYFTLLAISFDTPVMAILSIKTVVIYLLFYIVMRFLINRVFHPVAATYALIPLSFLPMAYVVGNELQYTLTKHGVAVSPQIIALCLSILLVALAIIVYRLKIKADNSELAMNRIKNIVIPVLLVSVGIFATHYQEISPNFDLLHNGNKTLPAQQFLQFGNIPLLDVWSHQNFPVLSFLYGALNGLNLLEQNIWLALSYMIVNVLICYFILRQFGSARWAALLILFLPIVQYTNTYYIAGLLPLVYLKQMREKRRAFDYGVFFGLALLAFIYHSSSGMIAVTSALVIIVLSCSSKKNVINAIKAIGIVTAVPVVIYFSYVLFRGENINDRLALIIALGKQDILICAYSYLIGSNRTPFEILMYLGIFPMLAIVSAYFALRSKEKTFANYGIVFLSVATIVCSLRALARHSLVEGLPTDYYPLLFVVVPFVLINRKTLRKVVSSLAIVGLLITPYVTTQNGIAAAGIKNFEFQQFEVGDERCDTFNDPQYPSNLRKALDTVLTEDQTFFETINGYLLYALMERECTFLPVSTLMIQYERPQIAYIHTLEKLYEKNKVPIIITGQSDWWGAAIDGIPSELSLFKLEEWIYAHYEPWIWVDGFHLWKAKNSGIEMTEGDFEYQDKSVIKQDFNMLMLPYIWGNYDEKINKNFPEVQQQVADNLSLEAEKPAMLMLDMNIDKRDGNYIYFRINAETDGNLELKYGKDIINSCNFNIVAGEHDYLVRISSQYNWVNEPQDYLNVTTDIPVTVKKISVLRGD